MNTLEQVLSRCQQSRADGLAEPLMARWLLELEGRLYEEVTGRDEPDRLPVRRWPEQAAQPLLVQGAYEGLYELWLRANVEFELGNYEDYNALTDRFEQLYRAFRAHWRQSHRPRSVRATV